MRFSKRKIHFLFLSCLCCCKRNRKREKAKTNYKNSFFKCHPKMRKYKHGSLAKIAWHYLCREGRRKTRIFVHTICFGQKCFLGTKTVKTRKNYKNSGFSGNCPKPKMTPFFEKGVFFDMGEKVGFTNCVFEKLCSSENNKCIVVSAEHSSCNKKLYLEKTENLWKIVGWFWTWQKGVLFVFRFLCYCGLLFVCLVKLHKC